MAEVQTLVKLDVENQPFAVYLLTERNGDRLELRAFDGERSWMGKIAGKQWSEMAGKVSVDVDLFKEETLKALTRQKLGLLNFVYSAAKKGNVLELTWKKHIVSDNIKFQMGSVALSVCHDAGGTDMLDFAVSALEESRLEIDDLKKLNVRLGSERQAALGKLEKCANLQEDIEKDLFGKFKVVLNEKKAKIRRLMEELNKMSEQLNSLRQASKSTTTLPAEPPVEDVPGNQSGEDTDDEMVHSPSPITTKESSFVPQFESLLGDPSERVTISPPVRRRKRNVEATPTNKVKRVPIDLPRPPSITKIGQTSGRVRGRSASSESKKSEDSVESDDLLKML